jgi:hypothetical protein
MKKFVSLSMATIMALGLAAPAFAATISETNESQSTDVDATYTTDGAGVNDESNKNSTNYTVTIPDAVTVGGNSFNVSATGYIFPEETLKVTATSANSWSLKSGNNTVAYKITGSGVAGTYENADKASEVKLGDGETELEIIKVNGVTAKKAKLNEQGEATKEYEDDDSKLALSEISNTSITLNAELTGDVPASGTYTDTLTFSVSCVDDE